MARYAAIVVGLFAACSLVSSAILPKIVPDEAEHYGVSPLRVPFLSARQHENMPEKCSPGEPLFLTPYIERNEINEARKMSAVHIPDAAANGLGMFSGFLTVNESSAGNLFFWFVQATKGDWRKQPLAVWLQGGPGASSLFGLLVENGPLRVNETGGLMRAEYSWTDFANMIYIDNPVGVGFSFTDSDDGYSRNEVQVGWNLYNFTLQFYKLFPELQHNDFYITGESYGGKYVPAYAHRVHEENKHADFHVPLKGIAIGNGWCDPYNMVLAYSPLMYEFGLADLPQSQHILAETLKIRKCVKAEDFLGAFKIWDRLLNGDFPEDNPTYFFNITGSKNYLNVLRSTYPANQGYFAKYLNSCPARRALHAGNLTYGGGNKVETMLRADIYNTVAPWLPDLFSAYRTMIYNGQLDIIVGVTLTEAYLEQLQWSGRQAYLASERKVWKVADSDKEVAGFVRTIGNGTFYQAVVRTAGHLVPYDQPRFAYDLFRRYINRIEF